MKSPENRRSRSALLLLLAVGVLGFFALLDSAPATAAAGPGLVCRQPGLAATGNHRIRNASWRMAVRGWIDKVAANHGAAFARWSRSLGQKVTCSHGVLNGRPNWRCVARSVPCRLRLPVTQERPNLRSPKSRIKLRRQP